MCADRWPPRRAACARMQLLLRGPLAVRHPDGLLDPHALHNHHLLDGRPPPHARCLHVLATAVLWLLRSPATGCRGRPFHHSRAPVSRACRCCCSGAFFGNLLGLLLSMMVAQSVGLVRAQIRVFRRRASLSSPASSACGVGGGERTRTGGKHPPFNGILRTGWCLQVLSASISNAKTLLSTASVLMLAWMVSVPRGAAPSAPPAPLAQPTHHVCPPTCRAAHWRLLCHQRALLDLVSVCCGKQRQALQPTIAEPCSHFTHLVA